MHHHPWRAYILAPCQRGAQPLDTPAVLNPILVTPWKERIHTFTYPVFLFSLSLDIAHTEAAP